MRSYKLRAVQRALKRLHTLIGLFALTSIIVFAATGIAVTIPSGQASAPTTRVLDYEAPGGFSDKDVADDVLRILKFPLTSPLPEWAVHRNAQNVLVLDFFSPNGGHTVTVLEAEKKVRIEHARAPLGQFLNAMHSTTFLGSSFDMRLWLWGLYIDCSMFSLVFMSITGPWLWLVSRPRLWWAQASFVAGTAIFAGLWLVTR